MAGIGGPVVTIDSNAIVLVVVVIGFSVDVGVTETMQEFSFLQHSVYISDMKCTVMIWRS